MNAGESTAPESDLNASSLPWLVDGDYTHAVVHLACLKEEKNQDYVLAFGIVELLPTECPHHDIVPSESEEFRIASKSLRAWVHHLPMSVDQALAWYESSRAGDVIFPREDGPDIHLHAHGFAADPSWPQLTVVDNLPFLNGMWGTVRAHYLYQPTHADVLDRSMQSDTVLSWFSNNLFFSFRDFPDWLGAVVLVAPNPLCRRVSRRHRTIGDVTYTDFEVVPREGKSLSSLSLELIEHGYWGVQGHSHQELSSPLTRIRHAGAFTEMSHYLVCQQRGLLDWSPPLRYIHMIHLDIGVSASSYTTPAPSMGEIEAVQYDTPITQDSPVRQIGTEPPVSSAEAYLANLEKQRQRREIEERNTTEHLFFEQQQSALHFVRQRISEARQHVYIVDAYFDADALAHIVSSVTRSMVSVMIMAGGKHLSKNSDHDASRKRAHLLEDAVRTSPFSSRIDARVMYGKEAAFHDRFLVVDERVWLVGCSFNALGDRASMVVQLKHSQQVLDLIERVKEDGRHVQKLHDWLSSRNRSGTQQKEQQ